MPAVNGRKSGDRTLICPRCTKMELGPQGQCRRCWGVFRPAEAAAEQLGPEGLALLLARLDGAAPGLECPACGVEGREVAFNGWFIDVCPGCHGVFVDWSESLARARWASRPSLWERLRAALVQAPPQPAAAAPPDGDFLLLETLSVPNNYPARLATRTSTDVGAPYLLEASGVLSVWSDRKDGIDALYTYRGGAPEKTGLLRVDHRTLEELAGAPVPYEESHVYRVRFAGTGKPLGLHSVDAVNNNSWPDNSGAIVVRLYGARR